MLLSEIFLTSLYSTMIKSIKNLGAVESLNNLKKKQSDSFRNRSMNLIELCF